MTRATSVLSLIYLIILTVFMVIGTLYAAILGGAFLRTGDLWSLFGFAIFALGLAVAARSLSEEILEEEEHVD